MKNGNAKKKSRFICLKCGRMNNVLDGVQRKKQRPFLHIKDCYCIYCSEETKNVEVRHCDFLFEVQEQVGKLRVQVGYN